MRSNIDPKEKKGCTPRAAPTRLETERLMLRPFQIEEQQVLCSFWRRNQDRLRDSFPEGSKVGQLAVSELPTMNPTAVCSSFLPESSFRF